MLNFVKENSTALIAIAVLLVVLIYLIQFAIIKYAIYIFGCWHSGGLVGKIGFWFQEKVK